jgi:superfamily II DNA or RNA helicase
MALRQETTRLLIADDVGIGKTIEALLILREFLERKIIQRFAVVCLPHLCEQWEEEIRSKLGMEAVIIRSNTQARLDRQIQGDTSVYEYYPYQIISIDFIKSERRRNIFIQQAPEMVIVDEVHTCSRPTGASITQQQRYHLLNQLSLNKDRHLVMLTATPHSGKPEEFQSLLGLINPNFESLDLPSSDANQRRKLATHFVQRKRADVLKWMGEDTPFPERKSFEWSYDLSSDYATFFQQVLAFTRKLVQPDTTQKKVKRVHYWVALALLRGVMSSPAAGVQMLKSRMDHLASLPDVEEHSDLVGFFDNQDMPEEANKEGVDEESKESVNPVGDLDYGFEVDSEPTQLVDHNDWTKHQKQLLSNFAKTLEKLANPRDDQKLFAASIVLENWIKDGFNPVVFCRYIYTAKYVGEKLLLLLKEKFPTIGLRVITSEEPDDVRKQQIQAMGEEKPRILIATDCLSEGINLQELFTAVLHYDLPWNPNRLEQREGRVDRFGQKAKRVETCFLYGADNPIDAIVLDVLLRKVREIKKATGINVPFPEDSQSIIDTITQALLLNPERKIQKKKQANQQMLFDLSQFEEAQQEKTRVTQEIEKAAEREKTSRAIFAQNAIKAQEIEQDLRQADQAIGDPKDVRDFVIQALTEIFGVQVISKQEGFEILTANLPSSLKGILPKSSWVPVSFESPTPEGYLYLGRNHLFVEQLCQLVMANTLDHVEHKAARASVIRTGQVKEKTTILLLRCRNVIEQASQGHRIVAEEMLLWGWSGLPDEGKFLTHEQANALLTNSKPTSTLSHPAIQGFLENDLTLLDQLHTQLDQTAEDRCAQLVAAHHRFSALLDKQRFQVVYPVLPMDVLGLYILLPEVAS